MKKLHLIVDVRKTGLLALTAIFGLNGIVFAGGPGSTTADLLQIPIGARAIGMGEAYTAMADDTSSIEWNPAGLAEANQQEATFTHTSLIENVNYEHLSYIHPGTSYSAGGSMSYLGYGSIAGYDNAGNAIGNQSAYSYAMNGALATQLWERVSAGLTGTFIHQKLAMDDASTVAMNAGVMYDVLAHPLQSNYRFGFSMLNLGPGLKFVDDREPLPLQFKFGAAAMHVNNWPLNLTTDVSVPNDNSPYLSLGSEYWFRDLIALRLGYTGANTVSNGFRVGVGLKIHEILFDYAYGSYGDFGAVNRFELSMRFGERARQMNKEERAILKDAKANVRQGDYVQGIIGFNELLDKDPDNDAVLKQMIIANEALQKKKLSEAEAQTASDTNQGIPSPEEAATAAMIEGQHPTVAAAAAVAPGDDPLDLESLPDATHLDATATNVQPTSMLAPTAAAQPASSQPAAEANPPKNIEAPRAVETAPAVAAPAATSDTPPNVEAPLATETPTPHTSHGQDVGAKVVPTMAPAANGPDASNSGIAPTPPPTQDNTSSGNGTLVNPNDIYGN